MADESLEIEIKTEADSADLEAFRKEVERLKGELTHLHEEFDKLKTSGKVAGESAEFVHKHAREMHTVFHALNRIVPGLGNALHSMFHPGLAAQARLESLALVGVAVALHEIIKLYQEHKKAIDEIATAQAQLKTAVWEQHQSALQAAKEEAYLYSKVLKDLKKDVNAMSEEEKRETEILQAQLEIRERLLGKEGYESTIALKKKLEIQDSFKAQERLNEQAAQYEFKAASEATRRGARGGPEAAEAEARLTEEKKKQLEAQKAYDALSHEKTPAELRAEAAGYRAGPIPTSPEEATGIDMLVSGLLHKADVLEKSAAELEKANAAVKIDEGMIEAHKSATQKLKDRETEAEAELRKWTEAVKKRTADIDTAKGVLGIKEGDRLNQELIAGGFILPGAGVPRVHPGAARTGLGFVEAEEARARGEDLVPGQIQIMNQISAALRAAGKSNQQIVALVKDMMDLHKDHATKLTELFTALGILKMKVQSNIAP